ncbi:hypothetical protein [Persephonella sp.]
MEYNLAHALLGRFGVLIPLLGLFFELGAAISGKELVSKLSGAIVILGSVIVLLAGITGIVELSYLHSSGQSVEPFRMHITAGVFLLLAFTIILLLRIYLYKHISDKIVLFYFVIYVAAVMVNLYSNEVVVHSIRGG